MKNLIKNLNNTLSRARKSTLYREKLAGLSEIATLNDFESLPLTTKTELRTNYPFGTLATKIDNVIELHTSSATTGKPVVSFFTKGDLEIGSSAIAEAWKEFGITSSSRVQFAMTYGLFSGAMLNTYAIQKLGALVIPAGHQSIQKHISLLRDMRADFLVATPSFFLYLIDVLKKQGIPPGSLYLKNGIAAGEIYSDSLREFIEQELHIRVHDHYGLAEIYSGIAFECHAREGLHLVDNYVYAEIIDPNSGEKITENYLGELVLTSLRNEASPLIRYRTGDITQLTSMRCRCGRTSPRIARIQKRSDDVISIRGIKINPHELRDYVFSLRKRIHNNFQILLPKEITARPKIIISLKKPEQTDILRHVQIKVLEKTGLHFQLEHADDEYFQHENSLKVLLVKKEND